MEFPLYSSLLTGLARVGFPRYLSVLWEGLDMNLSRKGAMRPIVLTCLLACWGMAQDWPRFRGPNGSGVSPESGFPTEFAQARNAVWRSPVRPGKSSPVLSRRHVFTVAFEGGKYYTQCFDRATGKLLWERAEVRPRTSTEHRFNEPAANTPVTDGENVYVFLKEIGFISYDAEGRKRWTSPLGPFSNSMGLAASPILEGGKLILQADQTSGSYLAAFQPATGELLWKASRAEHDSWATPLYFQPQDGAAVILTASGAQFGAHSMTDGSRLWSHPGLSPAIVASPVVVKDTAYVFGYGYETPVPFSDPLGELDRNHDGMLQAEEFGDDAWLIHVSKSEGDFKAPVTADEWNDAFRKINAPSAILAIRMERDASAPGAVKPSLLWRVQRNLVGVVPSPLVYDGVLYLVRNGGILTAFDAETGAVLKSGRLGAALGAYSASPVAAEGRIYLLSEDGKLTVVRAGRNWDVVAVSDLDEPAFATPALSGGRVYVRTGASLYAFGSKH